MPLKPHAVIEVAEAVLGCVCAALDAAREDGVEGALGCPCRACVIPGTAAWDGCDGGCGPDTGAPGQLTVSVARVFPAGEGFPTVDTSVQNLRGCKPPPLTAVELVITLLRCAPTQDEGMCPPSCEELRDAATAVYVDASTVYSALWCCLPGLSPNPRRPRRFTIGQQTVIGPQGGCVGLEQRVTIALPGCGTCPGEDGAS
ncbi:hypothetical protein [Streptomyces sp. CA-253872]|uniref:hypothetical protein n=1 Tax=Streptomyces sp. CA-253872 TaxID=3240067 RepID=UPI003D94E531